MSRPPHAAVVLGTYLIKDRRRRPWRMRRHRGSADEAALWREGGGDAPRGVALCQRPQYSVRRRCCCPSCRVVPQQRSSSDSECEL